jgi:HK97 family phage major capsid protein
MTIQQLREKRGVLAKEMRNLADKYSGELWTAEIQAQWDTASAEIDRIDAEIGRFQKVLDMEAANQQAIIDRVERDNISGDEAAHRNKLDNKIFDTWLRGGNDALTSDQLAQVRDRAARRFGNLGTQVPSEGGFLAPDEPSNQLLLALKEFGGMREAATTMATSTGNTIPFPTTDTTAAVATIVGENTAVGNAATRTFGVVNIGSYMYTTGGIAIPWQLIQDSLINIEAEVIRGLSECMYRGQNAHFTTGTGNGQPAGILPRCGLGKTGAAGQTTTVLFDDLIDLEHSIDPAYRKLGCRFMFHDTTLRELKKLKDGMGMPIWMPGYTQNAPDSIMGYPYVINQDMPVMAPSAKPIIFGNLWRYRIRDVMGYMLFRMTDSAYTLQGQVGFVGFMRSDGNMIAADNTTVKYYANPAA